MSYKVVWDNGAGASGEFPEVFETFADADSYGRIWADDANLRDFGTTTPIDGDGYSFDVVEVVDPPQPTLRSDLVDVGSLAVPEQFVPANSFLLGRSLDMSGPHSAAKARYFLQALEHVTDDSFEDWISGLRDDIKKRWNPAFRVTVLELGKRFDWYLIDRNYSPPRIWMLPESSVDHEMVLRYVEARGFFSLRGLMTWFGFAHAFWPFLSQTNIRMYPVADTLMLRLPGHGVLGGLSGSVEFASHHGPFVIPAPRFVVGERVATPQWRASVRAAVLLLPQHGLTPPPMAATEIDAIAVTRYAMQKLLPPRQAAQFFLEQLHPRRKTAPKGVWEALDLLPSSVP